MACLVTGSASAAEEEESATTELNGTRIVPLEPLPGESAPDDGKTANGSRPRHSAARVVPLEPLPAARKPAGNGSRPNVLLSPRETREVEVAVYEWASAWSSQQVNDYLEFYARDFEPSSSMTREQWRTQRQDRVSSPRFVSVTLGTLAIGGGGTDSAWAEFVQSYRATGYSDTVVKRLEWTREDGLWRILRESVVSLVPVDLNRGGR